MSQNPTSVRAAVEAMLIAGEQIVAIVPSQQRVISVTTGRVFLHEDSGGFSVIRNTQIDAVEVSDGRRGEKFLKLFFGGLSRTISAPDSHAVTAILGALA